MATEGSEFGAGGRLGVASWRARWQDVGVGCTRHPAGRGRLRPYAPGARIRLHAFAYSDCSECVSAQRSLTSEHGTVFHAVFVYFEICRGARVRGLTRIILRAPGRIQKSRVRRAGVLGAGGFPFDCRVFAENPVTCRLQPVCRGNLVNDGESSGPKFIYQMLTTRNTCNLIAS